MTKSQLAEAHQIFVDDIDIKAIAEMGKCFEDLQTLEKKYGTIFSDCVLYLAGEKQMEAERIASDEPPPKEYWFYDYEGGQA